MKTDVICIHDIRFVPDSHVQALNRAFAKMNIPVFLELVPFEGKNTYGDLYRIKVTKMDDDLNEPLGTPSCNLGEACESCQ